MTSCAVRWAKVLVRGLDRKDGRSLDPHEDQSYEPSSLDVERRLCGPIGHHVGNPPTPASASDI
jgi:hypothetical protein